jgi:copper chaperone CopZ
MNNRAYDNLRGAIVLKKTYKMENLDCANCAAKMEQAICKLDGVEKATVNFLMQKVTIEADAERMADIVKQADACCSRVDRDCHILYK